MTLFFSSFPRPLLFAVNDQIHFCEGFSFNAHRTKKCWRYDMGAKSWLRAGDISGWSGSDGPSRAMPYDEGRKQLLLGGHQGG